MLKNIRPAITIVSLVSLFCIFVSIASATPPAPTVTFIQTPPSSTNATSATFDWTTTRQVSLTTCSLDASSFVACSKPKTYSRLSVGTHSFSVHVQNSKGLGNTASYSWSITSGPPPPPLPACSDGIDNDSDGLIDYPADLGCTSSSDTDETNITPPPPNCSGVQVAPGTDTVAGATVNRSAGTTYCFGAGVYRFTFPIVPRTGDSFVGSPGAIWNGSKLLTGFTQSGSTWYIGGQTMESFTNPGYGDNCGPPFGPAGSTLCMYNNDVYYDDQLLIRVGSISEVGPGKFFFDYGAVRIYIGDNPSGHKVEVGLASRAISGEGSGTTNVNFSGLTVEKFASGAGDAALQGRTTYSFDHDEVRLNHAGGIKGEHVFNSYIHDNGQFGISFDNSSLGDIENNEFKNNHKIKLACWHSSDIKMLRTIGAKILNNYIHDDPDCGGIWQDWDNTGAIIDGNRIEHIGYIAIELEASCNGKIRNNTILDAGSIPYTGASDSGGRVERAAILAYTSTNVEVYGNDISGSRDGITAESYDRGATGPNCGTPIMNNFNVHDNRIGARDIAAGVAGPPPSGTVFDHNTYSICNSTLFAGPSGSYWGLLSWSQWRAIGRDSNSSVSFVC